MKRASSDPILKARQFDPRIARWLKPRSVRLPRAPHADVFQATKNDLDVRIGADSMAFIDTRWYPWPELRTKLKELAGRNPSKRVILSADTRLPFREISRAMRAIVDAGFRNVFVETRSADPLLEVGFVFGVEPIP